MSSYYPPTPQRRIRPGSVLALVGGILAFLSCFFPFYSASVLGTSVQASLIGMANQTPPLNYQLLCILPLVAAALLLPLAVLNLLGRSSLLAALLFLFGTLGLGVLIVLYFQLLAPPEELANYLSFGAGGIALGFLLGLIGGLMDSLR